MSGFSLSIIFSFSLNREILAWRQKWKASRGTIMIPVIPPYGGAGTGEWCWPLLYLHFRKYLWQVDYN